MELDVTYDTPLLTALEQAAPHDHLSLVYESSEEHYGVAIPFIQLGLDRGEKCVYIADEGTDAMARDAMYAARFSMSSAESGVTTRFMSSDQVPVRAPCCMSYSCRTM